MHGPQAQYLLAQAMHHLSYLMSASGHGAHPHPGVEQPSWPPLPAPGHVSGLAGPSASSYGPPPHFISRGSYDTPHSTPPHSRHRHSFNSSPIASSGVSSSNSIPSAYTTPVRAHPYPYTFTPSLSNATLPPSSPEDQHTASPPSPHLRHGDIEITRSKSLMRGQSKSRGRRVSFRIDDDRAHGLNEHERGQRRSLLPLRFDQSQDDDDNGIDELELPDLSGQTSSNRGRGKSARRESPSGFDVRMSPTPRSGTEKGKGKAKVVTALVVGTTRIGEESESLTRVLPGHREGRRYERGQTPGPPSVTGRTRSILRREKRP
jgi:hypothetical protein